MHFKKLILIFQKSVKFSTISTALGGIFDKNTAIKLFPSPMDLIKCMFNYNCINGLGVGLLFPRLFLWVLCNFFASFWRCFRRRIHMRIPCGISIEPVNLISIIFGSLFMSVIICVGWNIETLKYLTRELVCIQGKHLFFPWDTLKNVRNRVLHGWPVVILCVNYHVIVGG